VCPSWYLSLVIELERDCGDRFALDTNCINARGRLPEITQLEVWHEDVVITLVTADVAQEEMRAGPGGHRRWLKSIEYPSVDTILGNPGARELRVEIERAIFPHGAKSPQDRADVLIALNAEHIGAILVTTDGDSKSQPRGVLGSRAELDRLGVRVMRPSEAVSFVRGRIRVRDDEARFRAGEEGVAVPAWVGQD
jgi:predicted nucleic acid-binding protein